MIPPPLIVKSFKSVSSSPPSSLSLGLYDSLSYSSNGSVDFTSRKKSHDIKKELDERSANITPSKFGDETIRGPRVPFERENDDYIKRLSQMLDRQVTPSPGSPKTKNRKKKRHLKRVATNQNTAKERIDARRDASQRTTRGGRIFKFKTKKTKIKNKKKTKIKNKKKTKITNKKTKKQKNKKQKTKNKKTKKQKNKKTKKQKNKKQKLKIK